ncbi:MAG: hypothetical protein FADNKDHG_00493 [Holosporales bacterium]
MWFIFYSLNITFNIKRTMAYLFLFFSIFYAQAASLDQELTDFFKSIRAIVGDQGPTCFISRAYSNELPDIRALHKTINDGLLKAGIRTYFDTNLGRRGLNPGQKIRLYIDKIKESNFVLCLMTTCYKKRSKKKSSGVKKEVRQISERLKIRSSQRNDINGTFLIGMILNGDIQSAVPRAFRSRLMLDHQNKELKQIFKDIFFHVYAVYFRLNFDRADEIKEILINFFQRPLSLHSSLDTQFTQESLPEETQILEERPTLTRHAQHFTRASRTRDLNHPSYPTDKRAYVGESHVLGLPMPRSTSFLLNQSSFDSLERQESLVFDLDDAPRFERQESLVFDLDDAPRFERQKSLVLDIEYAPRFERQKSLVLDIEYAPRLERQKSLELDIEYAPRFERQKSLVVNVDEASQLERQASLDIDLDDAPRFERQKSLVLDIEYAPQFERHVSLVVNVDEASQLERQASLDIDLTPVLRRKRWRSPEN